MNAPRRQRRRLHLFLAGHVGAVSLIYGLALKLGGGIASVPFPPDLPQVAPSRTAAPQPTAAAVDLEVRLVPLGAPDVEAPWLAEARAGAR